MQMLVKIIIGDDYYVDIYIYIYVGELRIVESLLEIHAFIVILR